MGVTIARRLKKRVIPSQSIQSSTPFLTVVVCSEYGFNICLVYSQDGFQRVYQRITSSLIRGRVIGVPVDKPNGTILVTIIRHGLASQKVESFYSLV